MATPIGIQLYSVREEAASDFEGTVRKVAAMGYAGAETAGFADTTPKEAARLFEDLGLAVIAAHGPLPVGADKNKVLDEAAALECDRIVTGGGFRDFVATGDVEEVCDVFNEAAANAAERGCRFGLHNHWHEFKKIGDKYPYEIMLERLSEDVFFELDTYWAAIAGADPVEVLRRMGRRAPLLHIKDGPMMARRAHTAVGSGGMDFPPIIEAAQAEWLIVELDACDTDMTEAVRASIDYLTREGLGAGVTSV